MPYYNGDFYNPRMIYPSKGDYYAGDPGFFSILGGIAKRAAGFIPGVGPALSGIIPSGARAAVPAITGAAAGAAATTGIKGALKRAGGFALKHPVLTGAGAAGAGALVGAGVEGGIKGLFGGRMRRRRRMNACNPRALRRALRRAHAFAKFARKVVRVEHRFKKPRGTWPRGHGKKRARR